jgi:phosphoribosylformimino-5-aminoimidazole carboxamide ribotide isomerase
MIIFPAIDIKDGCCVRLRRGEFSTAEQVASDPLDTALSFARAGARWLHAVDLDGALAGRPINEEIFLRLVKESGLEVQLGGGIRDMATVDRYLSSGVSRVVLGSAALKSPAFVREAVSAYGERIAVGIDVRGGMVAAEAWTDTSGTDYLPFARMMEDIGVGYLIYTDIARDGTLSGPPLEGLDALARTVCCRLIASGGIKDTGHIEELSKRGLYGAICGRSLYSGTLSLAEAIRKAGECVAG